MNNVKTMFEIGIVEIEYWFYNNNETLIDFLINTNGSNILCIRYSTMTNNLTNFRCRNEYLLNEVIEYLNKNSFTINQFHGFENLTKIKTIRK